MARHLRLEFEGAIYHITSRGNERSNIFAEDRNRGQSSHLGIDRDEGIV